MSESGHGSDDRADLHTALESCCDLCHPALLDRTRPGPPPQKARANGSKKTGVCVDLKLKLEAWRTSIIGTQYSAFPFAPSAILSDSLLETISSIGPIDSYEDLHELLEPQWKFWKRHGQSLWDTIKEVPRDKFLSGAAGTGDVSRKRKERDDGEGDGGQKEKQTTPPSIEPSAPSMSTMTGPSTSITTPGPTTPHPVVPAYRFPSGHSQLTQLPAPTPYYHPSMPYWPYSYSYYPYPYTPVPSFPSSGHQTQSSVYYSTHNPSSSSSNSNINR